MSADSDYARVAAFLAQQQLAPYVSYVARDKINGFGVHDSNGRIVVRTKDGKIVAGEQNLNIDVHEAPSNTGLSSNPVSKPILATGCYRATSETAATIDGKPAIELALAPTCGSSQNYPLTALYADPQSFRPLEVHGTVVPSDSDAKHVRIAIDQRYAAFAGRWMPSTLKVDVSGSGLLFWVQIHVNEVYSDYEFADTQPSAE
jgi:hypothetical protein